MVKLIVNADDLGYSSHRDSGIFQAFHEGIVTSASLIVNGTSCEHAAKYARTHGLELGLHLNLTEGKPLSQCPSLVDHTGTMYYKMKFWEHKFDKQDVQRETVAQLERFQELTGHYPHHVDGHQHVQIVPSIPEFIAPILQRYGVRSIRVPDVDIDPIHWLEETVRQRYELRYVAAVKARLVYLKCGIRAPECFVGVGLCGTQMSPVRIKELLRNCYGTVEFMVHPGHIADVSAIAGCGAIDQDGFDLDEGRKHECRTLCSIELEQVEMITWKQFCA